GQLFVFRSLKHLLRELVALSGIDHFLRPFFGILEFSLKQIEPRETEPRCRRGWRGTQKIRLRSVILFLLEIKLAQSVQGGRVVWVEFKDLLKILFGFLSVAGIKSRPTQPVPRLGVT